MVVPDKFSNGSHLLVEFSFNMVHRKKINEIGFTNLKNMVNSITEHTKKNFSYVISQEDFKGNRCGWFCPLTSTYFYIYHYNLNRDTDKTLRLQLDSMLKRKIASIYFSNCSSDEEYNILIEKMDKLKAFW
jgi:hypothetical protein